MVAGIIAMLVGSLARLTGLGGDESQIINVINWDIIASEVMRALAGSMGLVFTIPITAFIAAGIEKE